MAPDPLRILTETAADVGSQYTALTQAGIPPHVAGILLGQMLGVIATQAAATDPDRIFDE